MATTILAQADDSPRHHHLRQRIDGQVEAVRALLERPRLAAPTQQTEDRMHRSEWGPPHGCRDCGAEVSWHTGRRWYINLDGFPHRCPALWPPRDRRAGW